MIEAWLNLVIRKGKIIEQIKHGSKQTANMRLQKLAEQLLVKLARIEVIDLFLSLYLLLHTRQYI